MAHWHDWWNKLSGFQRQLILLMSMVDDFWSSLTEGQRTVTGDWQSKTKWAQNVFASYFISFRILSTLFSGIIAVNATVLCCWRIPIMQRSMIKYFTSNPASSEYAGSGFSCVTLSWSCFWAMIPGLLYSYINGNTFNAKYLQLMERSKMYQ